MQKGTIVAETSINKIHKDATFESEKHSQREIVRLRHGNLSVVGRVLIHALRTVLVGANLSLIPVVKAANPPPTPQRPPKMKYQDLPIYESPHYDYKDYLECKNKCPKVNVKILQTYLFPKVSNYRKSWSDSIREFKKDARELKDVAYFELSEKKADFIDFMRDKDNLMVRQAVVAASTATGAYVGRGAGVLRRLFFSTLGALAAGALCFPKETDQIFRNVSFRVGKVAAIMIGCFCGMHYDGAFQEIPCKRDDDDGHTPAEPEPEEEEDTKKK